MVAAQEGRDLELQLLLKAGAYVEVYKLNPSDSNVARCSDGNHKWVSCTLVCSALVVPVPTTSRMKQDVEGIRRKYCLRRQVKMLQLYRRFTIGARYCALLSRPAFHLLRCIYVSYV